MEHLRCAERREWVRCFGPWEDGMFWSFARTDFIQDRMDENRSGEIADYRLQGHRKRSHGAGSLWRIRKRLGGSEGERWLSGPKIWKDARDWPMGSDLDSIRLLGSWMQEALQLYMKSPPLFWALKHSINLTMFRQPVR